MIIFIVAFALMLLLVLILSICLYRIAIARNNKKFMGNNGEAAGVINEKDNLACWYEKNNIQEIDIISFDGLKLHASYLASRTPTDNTVILAHGYSSKGRNMISYARFYYDILGFNVLMPDARGHGLSEGNYMGFGWHDRLDYLKWIDMIIQNNKNSRIILHGVSMGAATVLMASGENLPANVKAIISDCAFTSAKPQIAFQMRQLYHVPKFPLLWTGSLVTKLVAGYFFGEASTVKQVAKSKTPTLFIHGRKDHFVPFYMLDELYDACASEKEKYIVDKARHGTAYRDDKTNYEQKVKSFIDKYIHS